MCALFGRHEQRHLLAQSHFETSMGETKDALIGVVHGHGHTTSFEFVNGQFGRCRAIVGSESQSELAWSRSNVVGRSVLL